MRSLAEVRQLLDELNRHPAESLEGQDLDFKDPKLTPVFEELPVPEGTGRLLVMQIYPGLPPYTDTAGRGKIRIGKDCQPLTGTLRRKIMVETGETDYTAEPIAARPDELISASAMEQLRDAAKRERAPEDLLRLADLDLLDALGIVHQARLTRAAVLLAGREVEHGLYHFEYRAYPEVALREVLLNALSHADFRLKSPIIVKQFPDRLEVNNPGGFIGGITPENILHHAPVPRNPCLVGALAKLRLINRSNLGVSRMFEHMLIEGKRPPVIREVGESVCVTFQRQEVSAPFRAFVAEESNILSRMETQLGYIERGGTGRGTYWMLRPHLHRQLAGPGHPERDRRIDWEAAKTRVLSVLIERHRRGEPGLTNAEVRQITHMDRQQANRLIHDLEQEGQARIKGHGRGARYTYAGNRGER